MSTTTALSILTDDVLTPIGDFIVAYLPVVLGIAVGLIALYWGYRKFRRFVK